MTMRLNLMCLEKIKEMVIIAQRIITSAGIMTILEGEGSLKLKLCISLNHEILISLFLSTCFPLHFLNFFISLIKYIMFCPLYMNFIKVFLNKV